MTDDINGPWKIGDRLWPPGAPEPYEIKSDGGENWKMVIPNGSGDTITDNIPKSLEYLEGPGKWTKIDPNPAPQTKLRGSRSGPPGAKKTIGKSTLKNRSKAKRSKANRSKKRSKTKRSKTKRSNAKRSKAKR